MSDSDPCAAANVNSIIIRKTGAQTLKPAVNVRATTASSNAHLMVLNVPPARAITPLTTATARNGMRRGK
jgi:hypothetical protein